MSHARVLVPIANGTEEIEAVTIIDTLRRAEIEVLVASVHEEQLLIDGSRHIRIMADASIHEVEHSGQTFDAIVLPGGMPGATNLRDSQPLRRLLRRQVQSGGWLAAICASPVVVLGSLPAAAVLQADHHSATVPIVDDLAHSYIASHLATAFPSFATKLPRQSAVDQRVVVDGRLITSRGPGTTLEFAHALIEHLVSRAKADAVCRPMLLYTLA